MVKMYVSSYVSFILKLDCTLGVVAGWQHVAGPILERRNSLTYMTSRLSLMNESRDNRTPMASNPSFALTYYFLCDPQIMCRFWVSCICEMHPRQRRYLSVRQFFKIKMSLLLLSLQDPTSL